MNRSAHVQRCLESWLAAEQIKEIVVVDWSSDVPVVSDDYVQQHLGERLKVVRVEGEKYFDRCKALNLACQYTSPEHKLLLRVDVDYVLKSAAWLNSLTLTDAGQLRNHFIATTGKVTPYLAGLILINKDDFPGYNENLLPMWGYEDTDLNNRVTQADIHMQLFTSAADYILHLPHGDAQRLVHSYQDALLQQMQDAEGLHTEKWKDVATDINKRIARSEPVWHASRYAVMQSMQHYHVLQRVLAGVAAQPQATIFAWNRSQNDVHDGLLCVECQ
jgi:hypothetical protein